jgi:hypothetical protein
MPDRLFQQHQVIPVKPPAHHHPGKQPKMPGLPEMPNYPVPALSAYAYQKLSSSVLAYYEERYRQRVLANLRRRAKSLGYVLQTTDPTPPVAAVS